MSVESVVKDLMRKPPPPKERCSVCTYWRETKVFSDFPADSGHCVRYPPTVLQDRTNGSKYNSAWPLTHCNSYCGECLIHLDLP